MPADAHRVSALAIETFPLACPLGTTRENIDLFCATKLSPEAFEAYLANPQVSIWCAGEGDELVGYVMTVSGSQKTRSLPRLCRDGRLSKSLRSMFEPVHTALEYLNN